MFNKKIWTQGHFTSVLQGFCQLCLTVVFSGEQRPQKTPFAQQDNNKFDLSQATSEVVAPLLHIAHLVMVAPRN